MTPIAVKFLFHDGSLSSHSYDFQCGMNAVPRVGESVLFPSTDPSDDNTFTDAKTGLTAFSAIVTAVDWIPVQHEIDGPDVVIEAEFNWV